MLKSNQWVECISCLIISMDVHTATIINIAQCEEKKDNIFDHINQPYAAELRLRQRNFVSKPKLPSWVRLPL